MDNNVENKTNEPETIDTNVVSNTNINTNTNTVKPTTPEVPTPDSNTTIKEEPPIEAKPRIEMVDQSRKDVIDLLTPKQTDEDEFHLINKKNLPKKKNRYEGYEYKPPSKFKTFLLVVFMILIFVLVIFMPEINLYVKEYLNKEPKVEDEIIDGKLICKTTVNNTFTYTYNYTFTFVDKKLQLLAFTNTATGSATEDNDLLNTRYEECQRLAEHANGITGINVKCDLQTNAVVEEQTIDYNQYNRDQMISAFVEAGGDYPNYDLDTDIDLIEKSMIAANYTCQKAK